MDGHHLPSSIDSNHCPGVYDFYTFPDPLIGNTVIVLGFSEVNMVIKFYFGYLEATDFISFFWK